MTSNKNKQNKTKKAFPSTLNFSPATTLLLPFLSQTNFLKVIYHLQSLLPYLALNPQPTPIWLLPNNSTETAFVEVTNVLLLNPVDAFLSYFPFYPFFFKSSLHSILVSLSPSLRFLPFSNLSGILFICPSIKYFWFLLHRWPLGFPSITMV